MTGDSAQATTLSRGSGRQALKKLLVNLLHQKKKTDAFHLLPHFSGRFLKTDPWHLLLQARHESKSPCEIEQQLFFSGVQLSTFTLKQKVSSFQPFCL